MEVFLTKLYVLVCEEVVELVEVIMDVLDIKDDLDTVGDADWVFDKETDPETVLVLYMVLVIRPVFV